MLSIARRPVRRHAVLAVAALVAVGALGIRPGPAVAADLTVSGAEAEMVRLLNAERAKAGLVAYRVDPRLSAIARARSTDMATKGYFSHTQPDGRNVFDLINSAKVTWYAAGEIIAWNSWGTLAESAVAGKNAWMGSPGHRAIVMSGTYNYFGIGLAVDAATGKKLWTGVFIKGPDRTGGWVAYSPLTESSPVAMGDVSYRTVTISWRGGDIRLVVLTAGLLHYQTQVRTDAQAWKWLSAGTTIQSRALRLWEGHVYTFRTRACDRAGNCSSWYNLGLEG
jgi:uncharacterized protein YkwD